MANDLTPARTSRRTLKSVTDLVSAGLVPADEAAALRAVADRYAIAITPAMTALIDGSAPDDAIARQFVPTPSELVNKPGEQADPIGDDAHAPVTRDEFITELHRRNIGTGVHYRSIPVHPVYQQRFGWKAEDYPNAHAIGRATVSLPLSAKLTDTDVEDVIAATKKVLSNAK